MTVVEISNKQREFNKFYFPETLIVHNHTNNLKADTITMIILNKIMKYDDLTVEIYVLKNIFDTHELIVLSKIEKNKFYKHNYKLYIKNELRFGTLVDVIAHEMVMIDQMETNKLQLLGDGYVWKRDSAKYSRVEYYDRSYEVAAFKRQMDIVKQLKNLYIK
jgi:hypothetical protein